MLSLHRLLMVKNNHVFFGSLSLNFGWLNRIFQTHHQILILDLLTLSCSIYFHYLVVSNQIFKLWVSYLFNPPARQGVDSAQHPCSRQFKLVIWRRGPVVTSGLMVIKMENISWNIIYILYYIYYTLLHDTCLGCFFWYIYLYIYICVCYI